MPFWQFFLDWTGMAVPCECCPQESLTGIQQLFLFWVQINPYEDWKAELERAHFSKIQSGKITVRDRLIQYQI